MTYSIDFRQRSVALVKQGKKTRRCTVNIDAVHNLGLRTVLAWLSPYAVL